MMFKLFVLCYSIFGFCEEIYCVQAVPQGCETASQKEILELINKEVTPKTNKKRILLAVPVINNSDKSEKSKKEMPLVALRVLKPKSKTGAAKHRDFTKPRKDSKVTPPVIHTHFEEKPIKPLNNHKTVDDKTADDYELKEHDLKDNLVESHENKTIEFIHNDVGYIEKDQNTVDRSTVDRSTEKVSKLHESDNANNLERATDLSEVHPDIPKTNSDDFHKQVRARSLEDKTGNIYEEFDPVDPKMVHPTVTSTEQSISASKSIHEEKTPLVDAISNNRTGDLNNTATKQGIDDHVIEQTLKLGVPNVEIKHDSDKVQNALCNKTGTDGMLPSGLIERAFNDENEPVIKQIKKENDNNIGSDVTRQMDERYQYPPNLHTNYQPPYYPVHSHQPPNFENQQQQYLKYHLYPIYVQDSLYSNPVDYNSQVGSQPYQYIPVYDYPSRWYDPQNVAFYNSNPVYSYQVTGYPENAQQSGYGSRNNGYLDPSNYNSYDQPPNHGTQNAYQYQPYVTNVSPQSNDFNPYKPDLSEGLPPIEYPFEKELSDYHLNDGINLNSYLNWIISNCNYYYNWYKKQCRIQRRPYYQSNKYYYGVPNKYTEYPNWKKLQKKQLNGGYYLAPYQIQSNQNVYSLQNKKLNNRRKASTFPKYYEITSKPWHSR